MKEKNKQILTYAVSIAIALAVGGISAAVNAGKMDTMLIKPPLQPPAWVFPAVWTVLFTLMGISAAKVFLSDSPEKSDALFIYAVQLLVNFLWTVFYFSFQAVLLSFFWLIFLLILVILMAVRFERAAPGAGKMQIPYIVWLAFAAYLNFAAWLLNRG